jgi:hypothetical protein
VTYYQGDLAAQGGSAADHCGVRGAIWGETGLGQHLLGRDIV